MVYSKGFTTEDTEHTEGREEAWIRTAPISFLLLCVICVLRG